ncbi:TAP1 protein, partial [Atractosteus spatula]|nr:TAP1 protein [Atractosteus spatula]
QSLSVRVQESLAKANHIALQAFSSMKTVRSFANEQGEARRYAQRLDDTYRLNRIEAAAYALSTWTNSVSDRLSVCVILYYGGRLVTWGDVSSGDLVSFVLYELQFSSAVEVGFPYYPHVKKAIGASEKIFEYVDRTPLTPPSGTLAPRALNGLVEFRSVSFAYQSRPDTLVLKNVSLELRPGQITALVGPSGGGKTTCVSLLERFYEPQEGEILLDGHPLQDYEHSYLHSKIAVVSQEPVLFARPVRENIAYGREEAEDEDVTSAARQANAHDFIQGLQSGYNTDAGEKGGQLSGGQKQRIAIARALIRHPRVLVLDDATSSLDTESEHMVHQALLDGSRRCSVLLIAHRLAVVEQADHIVVLLGGAVVEQGSHAQLLERRGVYWGLVEKQNQGQDRRLYCTQRGVGVGNKLPSPVVEADTLASLQTQLGELLQSGQEALLYTEGGETCLSLSVSSSWAGETCLSLLLSSPWAGETCLSLSVSSPWAVSCVHSSLCAGCVCVYQQCSDLGVPCVHSSLCAECVCVYQQCSDLGVPCVHSSLCAGCRGGLFMCCIAGFSRRIKVLLFGALVRQEVGFFETTKTGDLTSRLATDTRLMGMTVALNVNVLLRTLVRTVGMLALMVSLSWKLTLLMLMETPVTGMLQNVHDTYYQRLSKEVQDSVARANEAAGESVSGIRTLRSFNTEESEARRYDSRLEDTHLLKTRRDTVRAVYLLLRRLVSLGMQVIMLYYGRLFIQTGQMTTGNLVSFLLYQMDLGDNIRTLIYIFGDMLNSVGAAGKVFEYLDRRPQVCAEGSLQPPSLRGHVQFRNVTFCYPSRPDRPALQGLSMELKAGQITALVGPSGGGKTTCVSLLERFYEPQEGEILLDGHPLQDYEHSYLHSKVPILHCTTVITLYCTVLQHSEVPILYYSNNTVLHCTTAQRGTDTVLQ